MTEVARAFVSLDSKLDEGSLRRASDAAGSTFKRIAGAAAGLAVTAGVAEFFRGSVDAARESNKIAAQTAAVIKSTGGAAGESVKDIENLATKISNLTGVDDEAIQGAENLLLTFTNIGKGSGIFEGATQAVVDMSAALGQDAKSSAIQLGKALNDPIRGVTALQRVGVSFTQQQRDQIKAMVEAGRTADAQKLILRELSKEFGGSAKAVATPFDRLKVTLGNLQEQVGNKLIPALDKGATFLADHLPGALDKTGKAFARVRDVVKPIVEGISDFIAGFRKGGDQADSAGNKLSGAFTKIKDALKPLLELADPLVDTFKSAFEAVRAIVETAVAVLSDLWDRFGGNLVDHIKVHLDAVVQTLRGVLEVFSGIFDLIKAVLTGKWGEAWDAVKKITGGLVDAVIGVVRQSINAVSTVVGGVMATLSAAWSLVWNGLKTIAVDVFDFIASAAINTFNGVISAIEFLLNGAIKIANAPINLLNKLPGPDIPTIPEVHLPRVSLSTPDIAVGGGGGGAGALRLHQGGIVPGRPGEEVWALLEAGERVIPRAERGGDAAAWQPQITVVAPSTDPHDIVDATFQALRAQQYLLAGVA